ncbi:MAG: FAD-dependent oxidoreductase [Gammaproteobacteria bacterium]|nr:FAD-dependent oxidoreductase [Gammaproteobacteria bacterium]
MSSDKVRIARRDFLASIGRAVGGSAMLKTMAAMGIGSTLAGCGSSSAAPGAPQSPPAPPPPPGSLPSPRPGDWPANVGVGTSVVILGGGISGMTTALEMTRLGYRCTILEATPMAGGRNKTIRAGDAVTETDSTQTCNFDFDNELYFNAGPARIPHHHEFLLGYCREFGVALETFVNENRAALLHSLSAFGGQPVIARRVAADTRGHISRLLATAVNQGALDQELTAADKTNVLEMLRRFGDLDGNFGYSGTSRAGFPGQESTGSRQRGQNVNPLALQDLINETFWQNRQGFPESLNQQATMLQPVGGMDRIARAFETQVVADLITDAEVTEIRKITDGVRINYDRLGTPTQIDADFCVCSIPATVLRNIPNDFSVPHQSEIANFSYASAGKIAFQSRRFWEQDHNIYGGISWTNQSITQIWYPSSGFGQDNGILVGAYIFGGQAGNDFANQSPQQRINSALSQGNAVHPGMNGEASRGISVAWPKIPYQLGAWGVSSPLTLLTPDDKIVFAGEHLSILQGWQEGAILSAYHAIDLVVQQT